MCSMEIMVNTSPLGKQFNTTMYMYSLTTLIINQVKLYLFAPQFKNVGMYVGRYVGCVFKIQGHRNLEPISSNFWKLGVQLCNPWVLCQESITPSTKPVQGFITKKYYKQYKFFTMNVKFPSSFRVKGTSIFEYIFNIKKTQGGFLKFFFFLLESSL